MQPRSPKRSLWPYTCALAIVALAVATGPARAASAFAFTSIRLTNSDVRLTWHAPAGSNYVVQTVPVLGGGFADLGTPAFVTNSTGATLSFTHTGALAGATQRFYRVRAFPPPSLQIVPTNVLLGVGMTNRYKVMYFHPDLDDPDVTTIASLTFTSLNSSVASVTRRTNGYIFVRGASVGTATLRASYLGVTNTASLAVSTLTGLSTVPALSQVNGYIDGTPTNVKVMGTFANGQTVNITPSCNLENTIGGGAAFGTRVDYNVPANVANSFALITGQSAAAGSVIFRAGGLGVPEGTSFGVNWCKYTGITLAPQNVQISVGETVQFDVVGQKANGLTENILSGINDFSVDQPSYAQVDLGTRRVTGLFPSTFAFPNPLRLSVNVDNGPGDFCAGGLTRTTTLSVVCPGHAQVDQSFNAGSLISSVSAVAQQQDGKVITYGNGLQRLNASGSADSTFNPGSGPGGSVNAIQALPDGKILIAGSFTSFNGTNRGRIARLNSNGGLDLSFDPGTGANDVIQAMALQPDGKIIIGGRFTSYAGSNRSCIARLNPNGTLDTSFSSGTGVNLVNSAGVITLLLRANGKVLLGGFFSSVNGTNRNSIAQLNSNGGLDTSFNTGVGPNSAVVALAEQADGKVIVAGEFTTFSNVARPGLARVSSTGTFDTGFAPALTSGNNFGQLLVYAAVVQPDGRILVGGLFNNTAGVLSRKNIARFEASGSVDTTFAPCGAGSSSGNAVTVLSQDSCSGHVYVGGSFFSINGVDRRHLARLFTGSSLPVPLNDHFAARAVLGTSSAIASATNVCASKEPGEPDHAGNAGGKSLWWTWTAPASGTVTFSTCGSSIDTLLAIYTGSTLQTLTLVTNSDNALCAGVSNGQSVVQFEATAGVTYQIAVDGLRSSSQSPAMAGDLTLAVSLSPTPFAQWNFNSSVPDGNTTTGALEPSLGQGTVSYLGGVSAPGSGEFAGGNPTAPGAGDNSAWNTSNYPLPATSNKMAGVQFSVSTIGRQGISISWDQRASNTGSKYARLQYSTNGVSFVDFPAAVSVGAALVFESKTNSLESIPSVNNNPNFAFRIVAEFENTATGTGVTNYLGAGGSYAPGGTLRFDQVTVSGVPLAPP